MHNFQMYFNGAKLTRKLGLQDARTFHQLNEIICKSPQVQTLDHFHNHGYHLQKKKQLFPDRYTTNKFNVGSLFY